MKVLALTEGPNHVSYRYRVEAHARALSDGGWTLESLPLAPNMRERGSQLRAALAADVVILQRKLLPLWQLRRLRQMSRVLIYDFDDAFFSHDTFAANGSAGWTQLAHFWATIYAADAVTAGNTFLAERAGQFVGPEKVHLLPTCVEPALYRLAKHDSADRPARVVWIGQHHTLPALQQAAPFLQAATARTPNLELRVICNQFPELPGIRVVPRPWSQVGETEELAAGDIGVSYLPDDEWSRGKCGLKTLHYMAAGLPVVGNAVGMNCELIEHGRTGFICPSAEDWADAVARLAADATLRRRMGAAAREVVERRYNVQYQGSKLLRIVDQLARAARSNAPMERAA